jgi:hypothetical protein
VHHLSSDPTSSAPSLLALATAGWVSHSCKCFQHVPEQLLTVSFALCVAAALVIWFGVDMEKGRAQAIAFSIEQRGLTAETRKAQIVALEGETAAKVA